MVEHWTGNCYSLFQWYAGFYSCNTICPYRITCFPLANWWGWYWTYFKRKHPDKKNKRWWWLWSFHKPGQYWWVGCWVETILPEDSKTLSFKQRLKKQKGAKEARKSAQKIQAIAGQLMHDLARKLSLEILGVHLIYLKTEHIAINIGLEVFLNLLWHNDCK